jgi:hypothetical protein
MCTWEYTPHKQDTIKLESQIRPSCPVSSVILFNINSDTSAVPLFHIRLSVTLSAALSSFLPFTQIKKIVSKYQYLKRPRCDNEKVSNRSDPKRLTSVHSNLLVQFGLIGSVLDP